MHFIINVEEVFYHHLIQKVLHQSAQLQIAVTFMVCSSLKKFLPVLIHAEYFILLSIYTLTTNQFVNLEISLTSLKMLFTSEDNDIVLICK